MADVRGGHQLLDEVVQAHLPLLDESCGEQKSVRQTEDEQKPRHARRLYGYATGAVPFITTVSIHVTGARLSARRRRHMKILISVSL